MRMTRKRLVERYADEYQMMRLRVELDLYPQVIEDFNEQYGHLYSLSALDLDDEGQAPAPPSREAVTATEETS